MLTAFTARPIIELKQRDKSKIETILAHGDRILVGLNNGALRIYRLNETSGVDASSPTGASQTSPRKSDDHDDGAGRTNKKPTPKPTDLLREVERFSTRAIEQLAVIKESNTIVSLSNYHISLHDLQSYELIETLSRTRNATCFAVTSNIVKDADTGIPEIISRLAVAVKRRLLLWSWHESELRQEVTEVMLPEAIRTVTWASATKVVCGMNAGYVLVNVLDGETSDIVAPGALSGAPGGQASRFGAMGSASMGYMGLGGYMPKPLSSKLADGEMLLAKDINTMFVSDDGKPVAKRQIPWQFAPDSIGYSYPYVLALHSPARGTLEVRNPETLSLLQVLSLPGASQLHVSAPSVSLAHAGKGFHISSERCVWKMDATDYDSQIDALVEQAKYDEAISVLDMLEDALLKDKANSLREVKMRKAEVLFGERKFRDAIDLFNEDDVSSPPERVLKLFPPMISGELSGWQPASDQEEEEQGEATEPTTPAQPPGAPADKAPEVEDGPVSASPKATGGFAKLLMGRKAQSTASQIDKSDTASIMTKKDTDSDDGSNAADKSSDDGVLRDKGLRNAVLELNGYLAGSRARLQRVLDPVTGSLKPAVMDGSSEHLVAGLVITKPEDDESRVEMEEQLRRTFRIVDTALFRAYMFASPSLAGSLFRIPNFCNPDVVNEKLLEHSRYNELVDFFYGKKLHTQALDLLKRFGTGADEDASETLRGPRRTIAYLQNLPPSELELILKHAEWTLRADPELAMEVFIGDTENAETLPRDQIVTFLNRIDERLETRYLEHIIAELNDLTPDFHNRLVELYIHILKDKGTVGKGGKEWQGVMRRFVQLLRQSRQYSMTKAFGMIPRDDPDLYEAQAVVLSNMGQHKQALTIIVFLMRDYVKAEEYCNRVHKAEDADAASPIKSRQDGAADPEESTPSIYHTLLSLYLSPPPPYKPELEPALDLLSKHGSRLPAASTLSLIPDSLPVRDLESYFRGRMRAANSTLFETRIVAGLRATALISAQAALHLGEGVVDGQAGRNRRVVISEERLCGVCHKRLGGSVVSVMPDNSVVHYGCAGRAINLGPNMVARLPSWSR